MISLKILIYGLTIVYADKVPPSPSLMDEIFCQYDSSTAEYKHKLNLPIHYLKSFSLAKFPAPPKNSSSKTKDELLFLLSLQNKRNEETTNYVLEYNNLFENDFIPTPEIMEPAGIFFIGRHLGADFQRSKLPKTKKLLVKAINTVENFCYQLKLKFNRARPHQLVGGITSALAGGSVPPTAAYPSGHSCIAFGSAYLLGDLIPKEKKKFLGEAKLVARSREWAGIHYPSDNEASEKLAKILLLEFKKNKEFQLDFIAAKNELKKFQ